MKKGILIITLLASISSYAINDFNNIINDEESLSFCEKAFFDCQKKCDELPKKDIQDCEDKCDAEFEKCIESEQ